MQQKEGSSRKLPFIDPNIINSLYKLSHLQLDLTLKALKERIDREFDQFRVTLVSVLNNLNFLRYHASYPSDDIRFIFKEKVIASTVETRLEQKEEIMRRMSEFTVIKNDVGGVSDNCIWELEKVVKSEQPVLNFKNICPSGSTFLDLNEEMVGEYLQLWRQLEGHDSDILGIFKQISPVFQKEEVRKLGVIFSQQNKRIISANLLFRASQNNFQSALFKQTCVGKAPTLMLAKSEKGKIFGAYTPARWLNTKEKEYVGDPTGTSFLFSLDNNLVFPIKKNQLDYAISAYGAWGPIYGSPYGPDLSIADKCHMNDNSCSSLGSHYDIPVNIKEYSIEAFSLLAGAKKFKVVEYEIYELLLE